MNQPDRLDTGGLVDRARPLTFTFNGRACRGYAGDTLASALLANGVRLVGRSFKYHRPRGILSAGVEDPNAMVQLETGARTTPNLKATEVALYDGLVARSVNAWPSVERDIGAANGWAARLLPAGFYYKTFFGSSWLWHRVYEPLIRRSAGWGKAPDAPDPDSYDHMNVHCDVLVVGGGPAGLMAALAAGRTGARVVLADLDERFGGSALGRAVRFHVASGGASGSDSGSDWADGIVQELTGLPEVRLLPRTTVFGYYDDNYLCALERRTDHLGLGRPGGPGGSGASGVRQRVWHVRAGQVVLATGAHERPMVFADNDRPGVMLAGAVGTYIHRWAVRPGRTALLFANNDRAYEAALTMLDAGITVRVVDPRPAPEGPLVEAAAAKGATVTAGHVVTGTKGRKAIRQARIQPVDAEMKATVGAGTWVPCDLLAMSGGYSPVVHLASQSQTPLDYDPAAACFRPGEARQAQRSVGACNGTFALADALAEGAAAGAAAARRAGFDGGNPLSVPDTDEVAACAPTPLWTAPDDKPFAGGKSKHFVDFQNDATVADIRLAAREGFSAVEHMKRYTLTGFGTDQGKTSNINALAILAEARGDPIPAVGTTTFRPPYTPVTFAALGGRHRGDLFDPARLTPMHDWHAANGALFENVGQWKRPWYYPRAGEDMRAAVARECRAARTGLAVLDASTLGKIDIQGPDAAEFLNRVYTNDWNSLAVGRVRYGIMCAEDGMVFDDGTTARLADDRYLMTTTTGGAGTVLDHLEDYLQTEWPDLRVRLTSVTEQWATVAIAGPHSRDLLGVLAPDMDLSVDGFPFLSWRDGNVAGLPARVFRISFTGELQYEINVPWHLGGALWQAAIDAGAEWDITPYGTETMHVLRAEKGFVIVGQDTDGTQTPDDLGLGWAVSSKKDFIGRRSLARPDCIRPDRKQLVGLLPTDGKVVLPEGAQLVETGTARNAPPVPMLGFVTSSYWSEAIGRGFALALVAGGRGRHGDTIEAALPDGPVPVTVCDPVFYDPAGKRRDG